jgi:hypothetical protein
LTHKQPKAQFLYGIIEEAEKLHSPTQTVRTFEFPDGSVQHYVAGRRHRDDGPAVVLKNGFQFWYRHDELSCDNGPAIV